MGSRFSRLSVAVMAVCASLAGADAGAADGADVVVTTKPIHALVAMVMDGIGEPRLLVGGAQSPHTYALKPSDAEAAHHARVFFRVSGALEPFTTRLVRALPQTVTVVSLAKAEGVTTLPLRGGRMPEHDGASRQGEDEARGAAHGTIDPHVWLDPVNAKAMVRAVARTLVAMWPDAADRIERNAAGAATAIDALDQEIGRELAPVRSRPFAVFHDAYQYFEKRYGLTTVGAITVGPDVQPSALRLATLRRQIMALGATCVFSEPMLDQRIVATVTDGTGARSAVLDPEGLEIAPGRDAYLTLMRRLAAGIRSCLSPGP